MLILSVILRPSEGAHYNRELLTRQQKIDKSHAIIGLQGKLIHFSRLMSYNFF